MRLERAAAGRQPRRVPWHPAGAPGACSAPPPGRAPAPRVASAGGGGGASAGQRRPGRPAGPRRAFLASRPSVVMSFPVLFFMGAATHFTLNPARNAGVWGSLLLAILALLEVNALAGTTGPTKQPIETVRGVIVTGIVTAAVVYFVAQAGLAPPTS